MQARHVTYCPNIKHWSRNCESCKSWGTFECPPGYMSEDIPSVLIVLCLNVHSVSEITR